MIVSSELRMAELDLKISSRNTIFDVGSLPCTRRRYLPVLSSPMSIGPITSDGSVKRVSVYSK